MDLFSFLNDFYSSFGVQDVANQLLIQYSLVVFFTLIAYLLNFIFGVLILLGGIRYKLRVFTCAGFLYMCYVLYQTFYYLISTIIHVYSQYSFLTERNIY